MELKEVYNSLAKAWAINHWEQRNPWCDDYLHIFATRLGRGGKVLDLGCGSGEDIKFLTDLGLKPTGVDFSEKLIAEAKTRYPAGKFMVMDIREMDFSKESFDGVMAKHSLLHLTKKEMTEVMTKIHKILKKDGWLLLTLKEGVGEKMVVADRYGHKVERFFAFYTNFEAKSLLESCGFEVKDETISKGRQEISLKFLAQKV